MTAQGAAQALATLKRMVGNVETPAEWDHDDQAERRAENRKWERMHGHGDDAAAERDYERWLDRAWGDA